MGHEQPRANASPNSVHLKIEQKGLGFVQKKKTKKKRRGVGRAGTDRYDSGSKKQSPRASERSEGEMTGRVTARPAMPHNRLGQSPKEEQEEGGRTAKHKAERKKNNHQTN